MKLSLAGRSLLFLGASVVILVAITLFEHNLAVMSLGVQRVITLLGLILPAGIGSVLGVMSLARKEGRAWMAVIGVVLNILFALFHLMILLYAG